MQEFDIFTDRLVSIWHSFRCDPITMNFRAKMEESPGYGFTQFKNDTRQEFLKYGIDSAGMNSFNYSSGQAQEYSVPWVARHYMLRYAMAYAFEYYVMYALALGWLKDKAKVYSFGCGTGFDCLSLLYAKRKIGYRHDVQYRGTDIAEWSEDCKFDPAVWIPGSKIYYGEKNGDMVNFLNHGEYYVPNILLFPKMLSEVPNEVMDNFCSKLGGLKDRRLVLCISYRSDYSHNVDSEVAKKIIDKLNSLGYSKLEYSSAEEFFGNDSKLPENIKNDLVLKGGHFEFIKENSNKFDPYVEGYLRGKYISNYDQCFSIPDEIRNDVGQSGVRRLQDSCQSRKQKGKDACKRCNKCPHSAIEYTTSICFDIIPFTK